MHTLRDPIAIAERRYPSAPAVTSGADAFTFAALAERVRRAAAAVAERTEPGDRVAVLAANGHPFLELYMAVPAAGRVLVPLNTRWAQPELAYALDDGGVRILVTDRDPGALADHVEAVVRLPAEYEAMLDRAEPTALDALGPLQEDDLAGLFYTGGTTGQAKGVMLTHRNLMANALHSQLFAPMNPGDRYLVMAPMFHAAGSMAIIQCIWNGTHQVVLEAFDPVAVLDAIERFAVTGTLGVPTMLAALVEEQLARPRDVSCLRFFCHGGSPVALEVIRRTIKAFPGTELVHLYGATETAPILTGLAHEETEIDGPRARSVGRPVMGVDVRVVDADGDDLPTGEIGEVVARGPNVMRGYWAKPEQTTAALRDGWYWTGDVGRLDEGGHLHLHDRSKDMIITGGENVYCTEVEDAIYEHPAVREATVFGIPDDRWGEAVHAVIVRRDDTLTEDAVTAHCRERIAAYKVPRSIEFHPGPLPISGPGKVLKRELRAKYWEGRDRSVN